MELTLSHTFVYVHDQDAALAFYRDVLGLEVRVDVTMEHMRWLTVGPATQPDVQIGLLAVGPPLPEPDHEPVRSLLAKGSLGSLIFSTDDVDKTFEELRASGAEVLQEPIDQGGYGKRDCAFRDPSGNSVRFAQSLG
jgi:catechol 2,3-dioxygenase-like lactoylglutathione lyase family enzyme